METYRAAGNYQESDRLRLALQRSFVAVQQIDPTTVEWYIYSYQWWPTEYYEAVKTNTPWALYKRPSDRDDAIRVQAGLGVGA